MIKFGLLDTNMDVSVSKHPMLSTFNELIDKYQVMLSDPSFQIEQMLDNNYEDLYHSTILSAVVDMALVPIHRDIQQLEVDDDMSGVFSSFAVLIQMVSTVFNKPILVVKHDFLKCMKDSPIDDIREAEIIKLQGLLN